MRQKQYVQSIAETPREDRPRERLLRLGGGSLSDVELLTIMISSGNKQWSVRHIAARVLHMTDTLKRPPSLDELLSVPGLGPAKAAQLSAAFEFSRRCYWPEEKKISFPQDVLPLIHHYADRKQEHFICVSLNGAHEVMNIRTVSVGLVNRAIVHPREVFADPIKDRAAAVLVAHNHPSGNVQPSREDLEVTARIEEAGRILGIALLDHIIFSVKGYYSFLEHGHIKGGD